MQAPTLFAAILCLTAAATTQGTASDYQRAQSLESLYRNKLDVGPREVHWTDDSKTLWFTERREGTTSIVCIDVASGDRKTASSTRELGIAMSSLEALAGDTRSRDGHSETSITFENRFDRRLRGRRRRAPLRVA